MSRRKVNSSYEEDRIESTKAKDMTYYDVLNVSQDANLREIKNQFRKLAVKYHPDHAETGDASIFALVARAYECLSDDHKRSEYDKMLAIERKSRKSDYINQKKAFEEFIKAQETENNPKALKHAESRFKIEFDELDRKRGFDRSKLDDSPLQERDAVKRLKNMEMEREQDELEFTQPEIFSSGGFDREKFNALFEYKYKQEKDDLIIERTGAPSAFNDANGSSYTSCNINYDEMFDEEQEPKNSNFFSSINEIGKRFRVTKDDLDKIKNHKSSYNTHNYISKDYKNEMDRRLREREQEDKLYESRKINDYDTDDKMGGYGFSHQLGLSNENFEYQEEVDEDALRKLIAFRHAEERPLRHGEERRKLKKN